MRLLLLENDLRLRAAYAARLRSEGHAVDEVSTLAEAQQILTRAAFDCLVLDRRVPDGDAICLVQALDARSPRPPVLVISGLGEGEDRVEGLIAGADDYMVKPVHLDELALRVRRLLVDTSPPAPEVVTLGRVMLHRHDRHVTVDGAKVHLTPTQHAIFEQLAIRAGCLVTSDHLLGHCWDDHGPPRLNPLHSHITRLRRIFEGYLVLESTWGVGYTLRVVDDRS